MNRERFLGLNQQVSRRGFLRLGRDKAIEGLALAAGIAAGGGCIAWLVHEAEEGPPVLTGKPIDNEVRELQTDRYGDFIPLLRTRPSLSEDSEIGNVEVGIPVKAIRVYGPVYPGQDFRVEAEGRIYGVWYELLEPVPVKRKDGITEVTTGFMAGNFLKLPEKEPQAAK